MAKYPASFPMTCKDERSFMDIILQRRPADKIKLPDEEDLAVGGSDDGTATEDFGKTPENSPRWQGNQTDVESPSVNAALSPAVTVHRAGPVATPSCFAFCSMPVHRFCLPMHMVSSPFPNWGTPAVGTQPPTYPIFPPTPAAAAAHSRAPACAPASAGPALPDPAPASPRFWLPETPNLVPVQTDNNTWLVRWNVEPLMLNSSNHSCPVVFAHPFSDGVTLMMILQPRRQGTGKSSFSAANGCCGLEVKWKGNAEGMDAQLKFRLSIGSGMAGNIVDTDVQGPRPPAPVVHDFAKNAIARLPKGCDEWNLCMEHDTFVVLLEMFKP